MKDEGKTATKKTVTTTTVPAATATAVPVGSADAAGTGEVTAPRCLIISTVVLDAIALLFWILTLVFPPLGFLGLACAIVASILACVVPCQDADDEFSKSITAVMWLHIAFGACYIVSIALLASAATLNAGLAGAGWAFSIITLILLIACLVMASILLCKINKKR